MQHERTHAASTPLAPSHGHGWKSLHDAVGTGDFDLALARLLSGWFEPRTCATLTDILRQHIDARRSAGVKHEPLACLATIGRCLAGCTDLPPREAQVCARILYGLSTAGIAVDLQVRETTVKTYRKRAYQRLAIGCERELITWYLRTSTRWLEKGGPGA